jgi:RNA polymerase sigma-70 factor (ECF subfamily)
VNAWNSMPPHKPERLSTFLGKLTRNISLNRYIRDHAKKRWNGTDLILDEVEEFIPDPTSEGSPSDEIALRDAINSFLESLEPDVRVLFVRRYWYMSPIKEIARDYDLTETNVKVTLHRLRQSFKTHLEKEGITV